MRSNYRGVKFYSANDLSIGWALEKAEKNRLFPIKCG